jgi:hypothetical protein
MVLARFYLRRLERFARLSSRADGEPGRERRRLAGHATLTAYRDCVALGLEREAREVLARIAGRPVPTV